MKPFDQWADELADHVRAKTTTPKKEISRGLTSFFLVNPNVETLLHDGVNTYHWMPDPNPPKTDDWSSLDRSRRGPFPIGSLIKVKKGMPRMAAKEGAFAYVVGYDMHYVYVIWSRDDRSNGQHHGGYDPNDFEQARDFS